MIRENSVQSFGWLSIYDLHNCEFPFTDKSYLQNFLKILVQDIMDMKIIGTPQFEYFEDNEYNRQRGLIGFSITTIISLSSITIHICDIQKTVYIDIFSCCKLNKEIKRQINELIKLVFKPNVIKKKIINRGIY